MKQPDLKKNIPLTTIPLEHPLHTDECFFFHIYVVN